MFVLNNNEGFFLIKMKKCVKIKSSATNDKLIVFLFLVLFLFFRTNRNHLKDVSCFYQFGLRIQHNPQTIFTVFYQFLNHTAIIFYESFSNIQKRSIIFSDRRFSLRTLDLRISHLEEEKSIFSSGELEDFVPPTVRWAPKSSEVKFRQNSIIFICKIHRRVLWALFTGW